MRPLLRHQPRRISTPLFVFERYSGDAVAAVMIAQKEVRKFGQEAEVGTEALLMGVVSSPEGSYKALQRCRVFFPEGKNVLA